jgi:hypothetical protein
MKHLAIDKKVYCVSDEDAAKMERAENVLRYQTDNEADWFNPNAELPDWEDNKDSWFQQHNDVIDMIQNKYEPMFTLQSNYAKF